MSEKSAWEKYKEKKELLSQQPIEEITSNEDVVLQSKYQWEDPKIYSKRLLTCISCPAFSKESKVCSECGCFMIIKTKLPGATCPLNRWES